MLFRSQTGCRKRLNIFPFLSNNRESFQEWRCVMRSSGKVLTNKIKVLDFSRELPMACVCHGMKIFNSMLAEFSRVGKQIEVIRQSLSFLVYCCKKLIKLQRFFLSFKRTGRTGADEIGVCKNGKLIIRRSSFLT